MLQLSLSTGSLPRIIGKDYSDFESIISLMSTLHRESEIDGFEFQNLAEWDTFGQPMDEYKIGPSKGIRAKNWQLSEKYSINEIANTICLNNLPILSVHANRDVGICLCSNDVRLFDRGLKIINDTMTLAKMLGSRITVFHLWDTWTNYVDTQLLRNALSGISSNYPNIFASVENIPTQVQGQSPAGLVSGFDWITLDTRWSAYYDELPRFCNLLPQVVNIHLRGKIENQWWVLENAPYTFDEVLTTLLKEWKYSGLLTIEPEGKYHNASIEDLIIAISELKKHLK